MRRTDEIYVVAEQMLPVFSLAVKKVVAHVGRDADEAARLASEVDIAEIKDPIRLYETDGHLEDEMKQFHTCDLQKHTSGYLC